MKKLVLVMAGLGLLWVTSANAGEYEIDKIHSHVGFSVKHILSMVPGNFREFKGIFSYDEKKPEASQLKVAIAAASVYTGTQKRDEHLKSPDFFDAKKYPTISFESRKVTSSGGKKLKVEGDLIMHGIKKPVSLDVEYLGTDSIMGMDSIGFSATTKIDRRDFNLTWGQDKMSAAGNLVVGNQVDIRLDITGLSRASIEKMKKMQKQKPVKKLAPKKETKKESKKK